MDTLIRQNASEADQDFLTRVVRWLRASPGRAARLPRKVYRLTRALALNHLRNTVLDGGGSTFQFDRIGTGVVVQSANRVQLENFTVEWDPNSVRIFSIGRVEPCGAGCFVVVLDRAVRGSHAAFAISSYKTDDPWGWRRADYREAYVRRPNAFNNSRRSINLPQIASMSGQTVLVRHYGYEERAIFIGSARGLTLEDIQLQNVPGMGIVQGDSIGTRLNRVVIKKGPGQPASLAADGFHSTHSTDIVVEDCDFSGQGDDSINIKSSYWPVKIEGNALVGRKYFAVGKTIRFLSQTLRDLGSAKVKSVSSGRTVFDAAPPAGTRLALELDSVPQRVLIRNNRFHDHRARGILFNGSASRIAGNRIERLPKNGVLMESDSHFWYEAPGVRNLAIVGNYFSGVNMRPTGSHGKKGVINIIATVGPSMPSPTVSSRDVLIKDNTFDLMMSETPYLDFDSSATAIRAEGNRFQLRRIFHGGNHDVIVPGYRWGFGEGALMTISAEQLPNTHAIYNCRITGGTDMMVSTSSSCEGQTVLKKLGYVYNRAKNNERALYRCRFGGDHVVSVRADCEGGKNEGVLGFGVLPR